MGEPKTLEHLVIDSIRAKDPTLYTKQVLPLYNSIYESVKEILREYTPKNRPILPKLDFVNDLNLGKSDISQILKKIKKIYNMTTYPEEAKNIPNVGEMAFYILFNEEAKVDNLNKDANVDYCKAKKAVEEMFDRVSFTYKHNIVGNIKMCSSPNSSRPDGSDIGLNMELSQISGLDEKKFRGIIAEFTDSNTKKIKELKTVYDFVKYVVAYKNSLRSILPISLISH